MDNRRQFLLASLGASAAALLAGCVESETYVPGERPGAFGGPGRAAGVAQPRDPMADPLPHGARPAPAVAQRPAPTTGQPVAKPASAATTEDAAIAALGIVARSRWAEEGPIPSKTNPMNGVRRLTVHHEGWTPVNFADERNTIHRLEGIRRAHTEDRHWGDIGYHFVVDRAGRIWEARPLKYQGAHVSGDNENNLGIMCLGNFDKQAPSDAQVAALFKAVKAFAARHDIPWREVQSHQERGPTGCPGANLQGKMDALRRAVRGA